MRVRAVLFFISCFGFTGLAQADDFQWDAKGLTSIDYENIAGDLQVQGGDGSQVVVRAEKVKFDHKCEMEVVRHDNELVIKVKKAKTFSLANCEVNFTVQVPRQVDMVLKNASGDLRIEGTRGQVDFRIASGDVEIEAEVTQLRGKTGSGSVNVAGMKGDVDLRSGSGDVLLKYPTVVQEGLIDIKTGMGDVTVFLPERMSILSDFKAGLGKLYNELGDSEDSQFRVSLRAGSGNLSIKKQ